MSRDQRERERVSARQRAETHESGFGRSTLKIDSDTPIFFLDKKGIRRIDILPYRVGKGNPYKEVGRLHFERTYFAHRGIGVNQETFVCPAKTAKQKCPICEYRSKLARDPEANEDLVKDLAPRERQLFNVVDLDLEEFKIHVWDISFHLFGKQLDKEVKNADEEEGYEFFADLEEGMSLKLGVEERSFAGRSFFEVGTIGFKRRKEPYGTDVLDKVYCLDDLLRIDPYEQLRQAFFETEDDSGKPSAESAKRGGSDDDEWDRPKDKGQTEVVEKEVAPDDDEWDRPPPKRQDQKKEKPKKLDSNGLKCPACEGTGKSSKGHACRPCKGTGVLETDDESPAKSEDKQETIKAGGKKDDWDNW